MARKIEYQIGFSADTSQLQTALKQAATALQNVGNSASNRLTAELRSASDAALQLEGHLRNAYNVETGKLDLSKLTQSLNASGMTLEDYRRKLTLLGPEGERAFLRVAQSISAAELPLRRSSALLDRLWTTMKNTLRWQLTSGMLHGFIGSVRTAYSYTQNLNESLNSIRIVTQKSVEDMNQFAVKANEAAQRLSTTTTRYTDAALIYYQQGLTDQEVEGRAEVTIKLANAAGEAAETASEQLTAVWNNFYDGSKSLEYYADVMTALGASTASSTQEISTGLQKFAAVADTVGLSYEYAAAALATVTATTRESADIVGTAFRTLFGRLESLKLGETLDDGTTLNKYSQALKNVGVDVKDVNGNLKDMDIILDETMVKWQTLTRDQQMALAQTVAGVRQYSQFIALMDNADFFRRNLQTALGSEGALEEQAEIFAESWEAARNRVRAAAEEIYSDIFNEEDWIALANGTANFLNHVDDVVVTLGGLKGVLNTVFGITTALYGDKITSAINTQVYNLSQMLGIESAIAIQMKAMATAQADQQNTQDGYLSALAQSYVSVNNAVSEVEIKFDQASKNLTEQQRAQLKNELDLIYAARERVNEYNRVAEAARNANEATKSQYNAADTSYSFNQGTFDNIFKDNSTAQRILSEELGVVKNYYGDLVRAVSDTSAVDKLVQRFEILKQRMGEMRAEQEIITRKFGASSREYRIQADEISQLARRIDILNRALSSYNTTVEGKNGTENIVSVTSILNMAQFGDNAEAMGQKVAHARLEVEEAEERIQKFDQTLQFARDNLWNFGATITSVGQGLMALNMSITAIKNLGRVFSDEDMDAGERLTAVLGALLQITFALTSASRLLTNVTKSSNVVNAIALQIQEQTNAGMANGIKIQATDIISKRAAAAATKALAGAETQENVQLMTRQALLSGLIATYIPYIAAIALVTGAIYLAVKAYNADADAAKSAAKAQQEAAEQAKQARQEYTELAQTIQEYKDLVESIEDLTKGTEEYQDAIEKANEKARDLLETHRELYSAIEYDPSGLIKFNDAILQRIEQDQKNAQLKAENFNLESTVYSRNASANAMRTSIAQEMQRSVLASTLNVVSIDSFETIINDLVQQYLDTGKIDLIQNDESLSKAVEQVRQRLYEYAEVLKQNSDELTTLRTQQISNALTLSGRNLDNDVAIAVSRALALGINQADVERKKDELREQYVLDPDLVLKFINAKNFDQGSQTRAFSWSKFNFGNRFTKNGQPVDDIYTAEDMATFLAVQNGEWEVAKENADKTIELVQQLKTQGANLTSDNSLLGILSGGDFSLLSPGEIEALKQDKEIPELFKKLGEVANQNFDEAFTTALNNWDISAWQLAVESRFQGMATAATTALSSLASSKELLNEDQVRQLSSAFSGLFDFTNLGSVSGLDQVLDVTKALQSVATKEGLDALVEKRKEILKQADLVKYLSANFEELTKEERENLESLQKQLDKIGFKDSLAKQFSREIEEIEHMKLKPIVLEVEIQDQAIDALNNTFKKASKLIDKDYKVAFDNVEELAKLIPEAFEGAIPRIEEGIVQLNKEVINSIDDIALSEIGLDKDIYLTQIQDMIDTAQATQKILHGLYDTVRLEGAATAAKAIENEEYSVKEIGQLSKAMVLGKVKDYLTVGSQDEKVTKESIVNENAVGQASEEQSTRAANAWIKAYDDETRASGESAEARIGNENAVANADRQGISKTIASSMRNYLTGSDSSTNISYDAIKLDQSDAGRDLLLKWFDTHGNILGLAKGAEDPDELVDQIVTAIRKVPGFADVDRTFIFNLDDSVISSEFNNNKSFYQDLARELYSSDGIENALRDSMDANADWLATLFTRTAKASGIDLTNREKETSTKDRSTPAQKQEEEKLEQEEERYHKINRLIKEQDRELEKLDKTIDRTYGIKRLDLYKKNIEQIQKQVSQYQTKLAEAKDGIDGKKSWLAVDIERIQSQFGDRVVLNESKDAITNIHDLVQESIDTYNEAIKSYNEWTEQYNSLEPEEQSTAAEKKKKEEADHAYKNAKLRYDLEQKLLSQYEETVDLIADIEEDIADKLRQIEDEKLNEITYKMELILDVKNIKAQVRDFMKDIASSYGDALTSTLDSAMRRGVASLMTDNARAEMEMLQHYTTEYNQLRQRMAEANEYTNTDDIKQAMAELVDNITDSGEALLEWIDYWENMVPEAMNAARERFEQFTDQLSHNTSVLDTIKELYALQGQTYKTTEGFNRLQRVVRERMEAQVADAKLNRKWYEEAEQLLQRAQSEFDNFLANGGTEQDVEYDYLKNARDAFLTEFNEAQEAYLSSAKDAMETARDMYLEQIDRTMYEFDQMVSNGMGLDLLQQKFDHYIDLESLYYDPVNEAYETASWYNKLQEDIDKATTAQARNRLKALQEEIDLRRESGTLSKYDLDILEAKYKLLQAQLALEDAQNSKTQLRLVRDSQGNWNYQYTNDPEQVAQAEQQVLDAQNERYNIAKERTKEVIDEMLQLYQDFKEQAAQIDKDVINGVISPDEGKARLEELQGFYKEKFSILEAEKNVAIQDMDEAAAESLIQTAMASESVYQTSSDTIKDLIDGFKEAGITRYEILSADLAGIQNIIDSNRDTFIKNENTLDETLKGILNGEIKLYDAFATQYGVDLDNMVGSSEGFEQALDETIRKSEDHFNDFRDTIYDVADETDTKLHYLDETVDQVADSTEKLEEKGLRAADALWEQERKAYDAAEQYRDLALAISEAIGQMSLLAQAQATDIERYSGISIGPDFDGNSHVTDYSGLYGMAMARGDTAMAQAILNERQANWDNLTAGWSDADKEKYSNENLERTFREETDWSKKIYEAIRENGEVDREYYDFSQRHGIQIASGDTGMYTGSWGSTNGKLAVLHEKELVLNQTDTANILSAVNMMRSIDFAAIGRTLDNNGLAAMGLLTSRLGGYIPNIPASDSLQQDVHIEAVFPNVTSSSEIEDALMSLTNDAVQYVRGR